MTECVSRSRKEEMKEVEKVWGEEIWLVNNEKYCAKLIIMNSGAEGSYHYHKEKQETFTGMEGHARLIIEGKTYVLHPYCRSKTIYPGERHKLVALTDCVILETSTHHEDGDTYREELSKA